MSCIISFGISSTRSSSDDRLDVGVGLDGELVDPSQGIVSPDERGHRALVFEPVADRRLDRSVLGRRVVTATSLIVERVAGLRAR